jgi:hypothetical protein
MKLLRKQKLKKYVCAYYGMVSEHYKRELDWFVIMAYDKREAKEKMDMYLQRRLVKGKPSLMLMSTFEKKLKELNN